MYNNSYEEYMKNSLGYNFNQMLNTNQNNQESYHGENNFMYNQLNVDSMYPEIYQIIYPMICKACMNIQENISEDLVSRITNEVYTNVENIEKEENRSSITNISKQSNKNVKDDTINKRISSNNTSVSNIRQESRQNNPLLRDLIKILVLRELLGNPVRPNRPNFFNPPFGYRPPLF